MKTGLRPQGAMPSKSYIEKCFIVLAAARYRGSSPGCCVAARTARIELVSQREWPDASC